jgi:hypothetical protein
MRRHNALKSGRTEKKDTGKQEKDSRGTQAERKAEKG